MPSRAARPCRVEPCTHLVRDDRPCPVHGRLKPWAGAHANRDRPMEAKLRRHLVGYWTAGTWVQGAETTCWRCGEPATSPDDQLGHVVALADGGATTPANVHREHRACNVRAGCELGAQRTKERHARG